jgi:hypothetical protein
MVFQARKRSKSNNSPVNGCLYTVAWFVGIVGFIVFFPEYFYMFLNGLDAVLNFFDI